MVLERKSKNMYSTGMEAISILMPISTLVVLGIGVCLVLLLLAALVGKFFGGLLR